MHTQLPKQCKPFKYIGFICISQQNPSRLLIWGPFIGLLHTNPIVFNEFEDPGPLLLVYVSSACWFPEIQKVTASNLFVAFFAPKAPEGFCLSALSLLRVPGAPDSSRFLTSVFPARRSSAPLGHSWGAPALLGHFWDALGRSCSVLRHSWDILERAHAHATAKAV